MINGFLRGNDDRVEIGSYSISVELLMVDGLLAEF